ncbi:hypothetical protein [Dictyobacter vulcani]|uniref:hypothetical protein n=1 Tax=Dictyobacter vulcani TaxID=2607529 RepID=UPI0012507B24|nr:hypothetical protein [Dictyobacter vulcani]
MILCALVRGFTRSSTTLLRDLATATAPTIPVGATALRVVRARWPAQTQQCGLRVWRPLDVHLACWSRRTLSQRSAKRKVLATSAAGTTRFVRTPGGCSDQRCRDFLKFWQGIFLRVFPRRDIVFVVNICGKE